jgi:hypothetical protein
VVSIVGTFDDIDGRGFSADGRGGGGIKTPDATLGLIGSSTVLCLAGMGGLSSPVNCGVMEPRVKPFVSWSLRFATTE